MTRKLNLSNLDGRDATVVFVGLKAEPGPAMGIPGEPVTFRKWLAATEETLLPALEQTYGAELGQALIDSDPEVDLEHLGRTISATDTVLLSSEGEVLFSSPSLVDVVLAPDGSEKERKEPVDVEANVKESDPLRWTRMRLKREDAVRRFVFVRTLQIFHVDGLSYDFLHAMAAELDAANEMVLIGAGPKGRDPLMFQANSTPYRGFLEGRVDGEKYQLLLHLSNLELKIPATREAAA